MVCKIGKIRCFLHIKKEFDELSEADFVDFWCIYIVSLAYEQFVRDERFKLLLTNCSDEITGFRRAYGNAEIPDFSRRQTVKEVLAWSLRVLNRLKPKVTWKPPADVGQFELSLGLAAPPRRRTLMRDDDPRMPAYIDEIALSLERLLVKSDLYLWLMVDRLDELFARRSETETRALRGLLRTISLFRLDRIRVKVFLRDDILDQIVAGRGFTALTHAAARRSHTLGRSEEDILKMIVRRIFVNAKIARHCGVNTRLLTSSIEYQKQHFYKVFVDTVHSGPNQSSTLRWIYNHTKDGRGVVTPRDVISLLSRAIQFQRDQFQRDQRGTTERLITGSAILYGHDEMSKEKRTTYLHAEFPHKWEIIGKLVRGGTEYNDAAMNRLFGKQRDAAVDDLISMGVLERAAKDGKPRYRVPFLYRRGLECTQRFMAT